MKTSRAAVLGLALALCACQSAPRLRPLPAGDPRPDVLLASFRAGAAERLGLRGLARLSLDSQADASGTPLRVRSKQRIVLARPARLRVEVQGLLGTTLAVLAIDESEYAWFDTESRRFESGPVHDALLQQVVGLELSPAEAVGVILGAPPLDPALRVLGAWDAGEGVTRLVLGDPGGDPIRSLDLDGEARLHRYAVLARQGLAGWEASFEDYGVVAGSDVAHRVTIETGGGTRAVLSLSSIELNPALTPDIFRLDRVSPEGRPEGEGG